MTVGLGFFNHVLEADSGLDILQQHGITREYFVGTEERSLFDFLHTYFVQYGSLPSKRLVQVEINLVVDAFPVETAEYWIDELKQRLYLKTIRNGIKTLEGHLANGRLTHLDDDLRRFWIKTREILQGVEKEADFCDLRDLRERILNEHDRRQRYVDISGVPLGFPTLDAQMDGAQKGDLICVIGRPGKGKTYILCKMALEANKAGFRVGFVTYEMTTLSIARRLYALVAGMPSHQIKQGRLDMFDRRDLENIMFGEETQFERNAFFLNDVPFHLIKGTFASTPESIKAVLKQIDVDILFIDGAYLMKPTVKTLSRSERVTQTTEEIKILSQNMAIPVVASYQFNREAVKNKGGGDIHNIYMSDAIGQLASVVLGIEEIDEDDFGENIAEDSYKILKVLKGREGEHGDIRILFDIENARIEERSDNARI